MSLRQRREMLGLTLQEMGERTGMTKTYYQQVESGRVLMPKPEYRRAICRALGMRHVDFLVEQGIIEDWEVPGFNPSALPDPELAARIALLEEVDLTRDNRGRTLDVVLQQWAEQDRQAVLPNGQRNGTQP